MPLYPAAVYQPTNVIRCTNRSPTIYWPVEHDGNTWNKAAYNFVHTINRILKDGIDDLNEEWANNKEGGKISYFNTYDFFEELYHNPTQYFNGSIPANVTGHCHQCPVPTDWHYCDM